MAGPVSKPKNLFTASKSSRTFLYTLPTFVSVFLNVVVRKYLKCLHPLNCVNYYLKYVYFESGVHFWFSLWDSLFLADSLISLRKMAVVTCLYKCLLSMFLGSWNQTHHKWVVNGILQTSSIKIFSHLSQK